MRVANVQENTCGTKFETILRSGKINNYNITYHVIIGGFQGVANSEHSRKDFECLDICMAR